MPNHVDNELYIYGTKSERDCFAEFIREKQRIPQIDPSKWDETEAITSFRIPKDAVQAVPDEEFIGSVFDFNNIIPYPEEWRILDEIADRERKKGNWGCKDGYNQGGYDWCVNNWGTKWNAYDICIEETKSSLVYHFNTAWSPPYQVILACAERFPKLRFKLKYWEGGCGFQGVLIVKGTLIIKDVSKDYSGPRGG